jgi:hypothetical protein
MLSVADLEPDVRERLGHYTLDVLLDDKRERWSWSHILPRSAAFLDLNDYAVLCPVWTKPQFTVERLFIDASGNALVFYVRDRAVVDRLSANQEMRMNEALDDFFTCFFVACVRVPEQDFFITIAYHECAFSLGEHWRE